MKAELRRTLEVIMLMQMKIDSLKDTMVRIEAPHEIISYSIRRSRYGMRRYINSGGADLILVLPTL